MPSCGRPTILRHLLASKAGLFPQHAIHGYVELWPDPGWRITQALLSEDQPLRFSKYIIMRPEAVTRDRGCGR